jgi:hypothetical protein
VYKGLQYGFISILQLNIFSDQVQY